MWGNKFGWGISAAIVIVTVGTLVLFEMGNSLSKPTAFSQDPANLAVIEFPVQPSPTVVKMEDPCDAGDLYKQAIADVLAHQSQYDDFTTSPHDLSDVNALNGVALVVKATPCKNMTLLRATPEKYLTYESDKPDIDALRVVGKAALNAGLLAEQAGNAAEAAKYYSAALALGSKMVQERLLYAELLAGLDLMTPASQQLESLAKSSGDETREKEIGDFRKAFVDYRNDHILTTARVITSLDDDVVRQFVGDTFVLAQQSKDPMWRIEAILKLGRIKFNAGGDAGRSADQRGAKRVLNQLMKDPDANVRTAATAAQNLTMTEFHALH